MTPPWLELLLVRPVRRIIQPWVRPRPYNPYNNGQTDQGPIIPDRCLSGFESVGAGASGMA